MVFQPYGLTAELLAEIHAGSHISRCLQETQQLSNPTHPPILFHLCLKQAEEAEVTKVRQSKGRLGVVFGMRLSIFTVCNDLGYS